MNLFDHIGQGRDPETGTKLHEGIGQPRRNRGHRTRITQRPTNQPLINRLQGRFFLQVTGPMLHNTVRTTQQESHHGRLPSHLRDHHRWPIAMMPAISPKQTYPSPALIDHREQSSSPVPVTQHPMPKAPCLGCPVRSTGYLTKNLNLSTGPGPGLNGHHINRDGTAGTSVSLRQGLRLPNRKDPVPAASVHRIPARQKKHFHRILQI